MSRPVGWVLAQPPHWYTTSGQAMRFSALRYQHRTCTPKSQWCMLQCDATSVQANTENDIVYVSLQREHHRPWSQSNMCNGARGAPPACTDTGSHNTSIVKLPNCSAVALHYILGSQPDVQAHQWCCPAFQAYAGPPMASLFNRQNSGLTWPTTSLA
jgi:hypothetical protein